MNSMMININKVVNRIATYRMGLSKLNIDKVFHDLENYLIDIKPISEKTVNRINKELEWFYLKLNDDNEFDSVSANKIAKYLQDLAKYQLKTRPDLKNKATELSNIIGQWSIKEITID